MHENAAIANQPQSSPAAVTNEVKPLKETNEAEPELIDRFPVQLKLSVGAPDDPMEHEADAMAEQVMRMPESSFSERSRSAGSNAVDEQVRLKPLASQITPFVQRCSTCGDYDDDHVQLKPFSPHPASCAYVDDYDDEHVQLKPISAGVTPFIQRCGGGCSAQDDERVQLKPHSQQISPLVQAKSDGASSASDSVSSRIKSSMGGGSPMQSDTKNFMESRFGADFSDVKIHSGEESTQLNQALNAKAFAVSNNIYFNSGQYQPETDSGKRLLAHELTHVLQQSGPSAYIQRETQAPDKGDFKKLLLVETNVGESLDFQVSLIFEKGTVSFPLHLPDNKFLRPGKYTVTAPPAADINPDKDKYALFRVKEVEKTILIGVPSGEPQKMPDLRNAGDWLAKDSARVVPFELVPYNVFDQTGKGGEDGGGGDGGRFLAPEPWLDKELRPAIEAVYAAKAYVNKPDKLIPYQSVAVQKAEGDDVSMIQAEKKTDKGRIVVQERVNKKSWVGKSVEEKQSYAVTIGEEIISKIEKSKDSLNKVGKNGLNEDLGWTRKDGLQPNSPAYRADIVGPEIMVRNSMAAYTMRLHYEDFDRTLLGSAAEAYGGAEYAWQVINITDLYKKIISERDAKTELQKLQLKEHIKPTDTGKTAGEKELDEKSRRMNSGQNGVSKFAAIGQKADRIGKNLEEDRKQALHDLMNPLDSQDGTSGAAIRSVLVNTFNLATTDIHTIMSYGGLLVQSIPAVFDLNHDYEREIPFPDAEGFYLVRCVAQPRPKNDIVHLSSLAVKVVAVKEIKEHAEKELKNQDEDLQAAILNLLLAYRNEKETSKLADIRMQLEWKVQEAAQTNRSFLDEQIKTRQDQLKALATGNDDARQKIEEELKILGQGTLAASGTIGLIITRQLQVKEHELEELEKDPATNYYKIRDLKKEIETLRDRLGTAAAREREMSDSGQAIVRPQAVFVNEEDGRTIPLLIEIGQLGYQSFKLGYQMQVSDVGAADGDEHAMYGETRAIATRRALNEFAGHFPYGRGYMVVRIPESSGLGITEPITLRCNPRDTAQASERLDELLQVLAILGLFVPGVGVVAAGVGAAVSAAKIFHRISNHTFEPDLNFVMDLVNILAFVASGVTHLANAKLIQTREIYLLVEGEADVAEWSAKLKMAGNMAKAAEIAEHGLNKFNYVMGTMESVRNFIETQNDEANGRISHAEARNRRARLVTQSFNDIFMQHAAEIVEAVKEHHESHQQQKEHEKNQKEKEQREKQNKEKEKRNKEKEHQEKNNEQKNKQEEEQQEKNKEEKEQEKNSEKKNQHEKDKDAPGDKDEKNQDGGTIIGAVAAIKKVTEPHPVKETPAIRNARAEEFLNKPENQKGILDNDMSVIGKLLETHGVWRDLVMYLEAQQNDLAAVAIKGLGQYREKIVKDLNEKFGLVLSDPKASTHASSDIDLAANGKDAGKKVIDAEKYMKDTYKDEWSQLLRMNFYSEAERLFMYENARKFMDADSFGKLQREISNKAATLNFAKMLQHAGAEPSSKARIEKLMAYLPEEQRSQIRKLAMETPAVSQEKVKTLLLAIDELVNEKSKLSESDPDYKQKVVELDKKITLMQMEANFRTTEAYISPGAGRHVVRGVAVEGHEAYQSVMANLEMIEHVIHIAGGNVEMAIREYEMYKYISRIIVASTTAGVHVEPFILMYYQASMEIYKNTKSRGMLQGINAKDLSYIKAMHEHFVKEVGGLLPKLQENAQSNDAAWNPDKRSLEADQHGIGNKMLMPENVHESAPITDEDMDRSLDKTFGVPETEEKIPAHHTEDITQEITHPTADGEHKLTVAKDGKIYRCSECEQLLSTYQEVLDENKNLKSELLELEQKMKIADPTERAKMLVDKVKPLEDQLKKLEVERLRVFKPTDADFHSELKVGKSRRYVDKGGTAGIAKRLSTDVTQIETSLGQTTIRDNYQEKAIPGGATAYGLPDGVNGFDRLHAIGPNVGHESPYGIFFGPWKLNHELQLNGIEAYIGDFGTPKPGVTFKLVVTVERYLGSKHPGVEFLNSVRYEVFAEGTGIKGRERVLRQEILVNEPDNPLSKYEIGEPMLTGDINKYLANPPSPTLAKASKNARRSPSDIPAAKAKLFLDKTTALANQLRAVPKTDKRYAAARILATELTKAIGVTDVKFVTRSMVENIESTQVESIIGMFPAFQKTYGDLVQDSLR